MNPVVIRDTSNEEELITLSTATSEESVDIDGVSHFLLKVEVSSASHPFFTGKQQIVDSARRVEKHKAKEVVTSSLQSSATHRSKKEKREKRAEKKTVNKAGAKVDAKAALKAAKAALSE